jgi:hypothetical protein
MYYPQPHIDREKTSPMPQLIYDFKTGDIIDPRTGEVVGTIFVYETHHWDRSGESLVMVSAPFHTADEAHPLHLSKSRYTRMTEMLEMLDKLRSEERIVVSDYDIEMTLRYLLKKLSRHVYTPEFKAALLYIALEMNKIAIDERTLERVFRISRFKLKSIIMQLKRELREAGVVVEMSYTDKMISVLKQVGRKLDLPPRVLIDAAKRIRSKPYPSRYTLRSIALAVLYCEIEKHGINLRDKTGDMKLSNLGAFMKLVDASPNIRKVIKFVRKYYYGEN